MRDGHWYCMRDVGYVVFSFFYACDLSVKRNTRSTVEHPVLRAIYTPVPSAGAGPVVVVLAQPVHPSGLALDELVKN